MESRRLSENLARLYGSSAFFRFGIELLKDLPEEEKAKLAHEFTVDEQVLNRFWDWVRAEEVLQPSAVELLRETEQDVDDVKLGIRVEVLNAGLDLEAGYRAALDTDDQFIVALEHLADAEDFWITWKAANGDS